MKNFKNFKFKYWKFKNQLIIIIWHVSLLTASNCLCGKFLKVPIVQEIAVF